jgi:tight adherence protein B
MTALVWGAMLCAALAAWAALQRDDQRRRARDLRVGGWKEPASGGGGADRLRHALRRGLPVGWAKLLPRPLRRWSGAEALCVPVGVVLAVLTRSPVPVLAGAAAVPLVGRAVQRRAELAAAERRSDAVSALCGTIAGDLRAGRPPHAALAEAVGTAGWPDSPDLAEPARLLLSAARFGGDVPHALHEASRLLPGTHGLAAVSACWQVAVDGGAGLAAALDRVAAALRAEADQRDDLRAQLAGPRSTAVLLALLPAFGVVLGTGLGAAPAHVLLHTPLGLACLTAGCALEWAGLVWTSRIIHGAQGSAPAATDRQTTAAPRKTVASGRPGQGRS